MVIFRACTLLLFFHTLFGAKAVFALGLCPPKTPDVNIRVLFEKARPHYNNEYSRTRIEAMMPKKEPGVHSVGLTKSSLYWKISSKFTMVSRRNPEEICIFLSALTLNYGFGETPVFIDQRYRPGGCPYREILAHENAHVAILDQEGKEIQRWLERKLTSLVTSIPPTPTRSPKTTQQQWMAKIDRETKPLLETLKKRLETAHARLDSPPSLAKTQKQCPKW